MRIALAVAVSCGCSFGTYRRVPAEWQPPAKLDCYASRDIATLDLVGIVPVLLLGGITTILVGSCEGACNSDARMGIGAAITVGTAGTLLGSGVWGLGRAAQCRDARQRLEQSRATRPPDVASEEARAAAYKVDQIHRDLAAIDRDLAFAEQQIRSSQVQHHREKWQAERARLLELRAMRAEELARAQGRTAPKTDEQRAAEARAAADHAVKEAREAQERLERLAADLEAFDKRLSLAVDSVVEAQNDSDRAAAKAKLQALQAEKAELEARLQQVKADAERAERKKGVKVSPQCIDNPLAAGCD